MSQSIAIYPLFVEIVTEKRSSTLDFACSQETCDRLWSRLAQGGFTDQGDSEANNPTLDICLVLRLGSQTSSQGEDSIEQVLASIQFEIIDNGWAEEDELNLAEPVIEPAPSETPIYIGSEYEEIDTGRKFVILSLSHPHDRLRDPALVIFQFAKGQIPDLDRSHYLPIEAFRARFRYVPKVETDAN